MQAQRIDNMFNFTFQKSSAQIIEKATIKVRMIQDKITEREKRITKTREEYGITDAVLNDIMVQMREQQRRGVDVSNYSYSTGPRESNGSSAEERTVGAGVINMLLTERDFIEAEKSQVDKLETIRRNLEDLEEHAGGNGAVYTVKHNLSYAELKYLGF